jgi:hypothetical protein
VRRYEAAPKWNGLRWTAAVDVFSGLRSKLPVRKRTIKGDRSFETREEALEHSRILVLQIRSTERWAAALKQKVAPKPAGKKGV